MEKRTFRNKAFLSYRHVEKDEKLASLLQEKLEHFRIPRGLQGSRSGTRGVGRIFRDTTDLGARADLTEELRRELDDSEYLIVLCSEASASSKWIRREIQYFLQAHEEDRILPVLTEGEPDKILPAVFEGIEGMPQHPIACDFRGNRRQALREELPRLASALIGCPYDELVNRRHRYEIRRLAAVTAVAALILSAAVAYYAVSSARIRGILRERQIAESASLALRSETALSQRLRHDSLRYALDALPREKGERPVAEQAVLALQKATAAYVPEANRMMMQTGEFAAPGRINNFQAEELDGTIYLAASYGEDETVLWNADTGEVILDTASLPGVYGRQEDSDWSRDNQFFEQDLLLRSVNGGLMGIDVRSGEIRWQVREDRTLDCIVADTDQGVAAVLAVKQEPVGKAPNQKDLLTVFKELQLRSLEDGKILFRQKRDGYPEKNLQCAAIDKDRVIILEQTAAPEEDSSLSMEIPETEKDRGSEEGQVSGNGNLQNMAYLSVLDPETGEERLLLKKFLIESFQLTSDGRLLAAYYNRPWRMSDRQDLEESTSEDGYEFCYTYTGQENLCVCCIDVTSGETVWETDSGCRQEGRPGLKTDLQIQGQEVCILSSGTHVDILAQDTGKKLYSTDFPGIPVHLEAGGSEEQEVLTAIFQDGSQAVYLFSTGELLKKEAVFPAPVSEIKEERGTVFLLRAQKSGLLPDNRIIRFGQEVFDPDVFYILTPSGEKLSVSRAAFTYNEFETSGFVTTVKDLRVGGVYRFEDLFVVLDRKNNAYGVNARTGDIRWSASADPKADYAGLADGAGLMVFQDNLLSRDVIREMVLKGESVPQEEKWIFLHLKDGKTETVENIVKDYFAGKQYRIQRKSISDSTMDLLVIVEEKEVWVLRYNLQDRTRQAVCLTQKTEKEIAKKTGYIAASPDGARDVCAFESMGAEPVNLLVDWKTKEVKEIRDPVSINGISHITWREDGKAFAMTGEDGSIILFSQDGNRLEEIPDEDGKTQGFGFWKQHLFTMEENGFQAYFRIRKEDVRVLLSADQQNLYDLESSANRVFQAWELPDGKILLQYGTQSFVFDTETGAVEAVIDNMISYNPDTNTMMIIDNTGSLAFSRRYDWKELVDKGRAILEGPGQ